MTEKLKEDALALMEQVDHDAREAGYQSAVETCSAQYAEKVGQMQADFESRLAAERSASYAAGLAEGLAANQQQTPEPTENLVFSDGDDYTLREARLVASFSYSRKFTTTKWGTLVLPVALDYSDWASHFEIAEIVGVTVGNKIIASRKVLGTGSQTVPNVPYLIRAKSANATKPQAITKRNCKVFPADPSSISIAKGGKTYRFTGSYTSKSVADLKGKYYSSGGYFVPAISILKPMRVYLEIN